MAVVSSMLIVNHLKMLLLLLHWRVLLLARIGTAWQIGVVVVLVVEIQRIWILLVIHFDVVHKKSGGNLNAIVIYNNTTTKC